MRLQYLFIYPVKSLGGISLDKALVEDRGLRFDRRFMLVDEENRFLTQRDLPKLALFRTAIDREDLLITTSGELPEGNLKIPLNPGGDEKIMSQIWSDRCRTVVVSSQANDFFSDVLGKKIRLVFMPDTTRRRVDSRYVKNAVNSFSDAFPLHLIGTASLDDLNSRLEEKVGWDRFRPNLVVETQVPYEEDLWEKFSIGKIEFTKTKLCARCVMTTINQETASVGKEPLKTLASFRNMNKSVRFGIDAISESPGGLIKTGLTLTTSPQPLNSRP